MPHLTRKRQAGTTGDKKISGWIFGHHHLRFHWMRDAGLSAKAWMDVNNNDYEAVREVMEGYAKWTGIVQHKEDPNCDVRIEPKFTIDDQVQRSLFISL